MSLAGMSISLALSISNLSSSRKKSSFHNMSIRSTLSQSVESSEFLRSSQNLFKGSNIFPLSISVVVPSVSLRLNPSIRFLSPIHFSFKSLISSKLTPSSLHHRKRHHSVSVGSILRILSIELLNSFRSVTSIQISVSISVFMGFSSILL